MSAIKTLLSVLAGITFIVAFFPYIKAILNGARPKKATWLIWMSGDLITLAGMLAKNTISGQMIAASFGATTVFILSLKYGNPGWTRRDKICISLAGLALVLWLYFGESNLGIALSLTALCIAAWPTYVDTWKDPKDEDPWGWTIFEISSILAVLAIPSWTFANYAPPLIFLAIDTPMIYLAVLRPHWNKKNLGASVGGKDI